MFPLQLSVFYARKKPINWICIDAWGVAPNPRIFLGMGHPNCTGDKKPRGRTLYGPLVSILFSTPLILKGQQICTPVQLGWCMPKISLGVWGQSPHSQYTFDRREYQIKSPDHSATWLRSGLTVSYGCTWISLSLAGRFSDVARFRFS